jgi:hypothetical protein
MRHLLTLAALLLALPTYAQQWRAGPASGTWQSDATIAQGGTVSATSGGSAQYANHRWGEFTLNIPVSAGRYNVKLHWQESWASAGQRVFHVDIEGTRVESSLDVAKAAGRNPLVRTYTADVSDGALTVRFVDGGPDDPMYSAIEVTPVAPAPPTGPTWTGEATLSWTAPTHNSDGTPLTDLAGYVIQYGTSALTQSVRVTGTRYTLTGLPQGHYYVGVRAVNTAGAESELSNVVEFQLTESVPTCAEKPADETRVNACVAPAVGSWTQTRSYASAPYPTCWTASAWLPASAPSGACVTSWKVKSIAAGTRPAYELVRDAKDTAWVIGYKLGDVPVGTACEPEALYRSSSTTEYHRVAESDVVLLSPTYKGRTLVAVCGK